MSETPLLLRFRERPTLWQKLQSRWQSFWQRLNTPRIVVEPPLQPARQKPFPVRPHHRRRQAVFAALASAPTDATIPALISHVRTITGTGCSRKLIVAWRQEKGMGGLGDRERGGQGDAEAKANTTTGRRWRREQLRLFLMCILVGATLQPLPPVRSVAAQEITISPAPSDSPISNPTRPRLLRIKLTLQSPQELRIKQGDEVKAGDILSDRRRARQRLHVQQRALQSAQHRLTNQRELLNASLRQLQSLGPELPAITFAAERAAIQRAETESLAVNRAVAIQQQKLLVVGGRWSVAGQEEAENTEPLSATESSTTTNQPPATDHQPLIVEHESARLINAHDKQLLAHSEIELHKAKLITAKETRAWEEQTHRVEVARHILSVRAQQQQLEIERARLLAQLTELDLQLANLTEVRAPFAGTIKRIEWEEMQNETITVLVYFSLGSR